MPNIPRKFVNRICQFVNLSDNNYHLFPFFFIITFNDFVI